MQRHQSPESAQKTMGPVQDHEVAESAPTRLLFGVNFSFFLFPFFPLSYKFDHST